MLLVAQFPLPDARPLVQDAAGRLKVPDWPPTTAVFPQFVRCFGPAVRRRRGADAAWVDERAFCCAHRALRFPTLSKEHLGFDGLGVKPRCAFRRLLSDGRVVTRVEVGISFRVGRTKLAPLFPERLVKVLENFLRLKSQVPESAEKLNERSLYMQGKPLAKLYARSTTECAKLEFFESSRYLGAGRPLVFIELEGNELLDFPASFRPLTLTSGDRFLDAAFGWLRIDGAEIPVWLLAPELFGGLELARSLRLCLLRLHAEQESLDFVLSQIRRGLIQFEPRTPAGEEIEAYLNRATRTINRESWQGVAQSAIRQALEASESVQYPDFSADLKERFEGARRQVRKKIEEYERYRGAPRTVRIITIQGGTYVENEGQIIHGGNFYGSVVNKVDAERIDSSFNTFNNSNPEDDLRKAVVTLHEEVKTLIAKLPEDSPQKEEVLTHLETFTEQAAKKKPLGEVLKVTGKGLVEAAKTVAEMVGPITAAVTGVLKLFGLVLM